MDGRRCHAKDGMHLVEDDGVLRHKAFLAEAHLLALGRNLAGLAGTEAEYRGNGGTGQHTQPFAEELQLLYGLGVDSSGDNLACVVRLDDIHHMVLVDTFFSQQIDGRDKGCRPRHFGHIQLQDGEKAHLARAGFHGKLDGHRRFVAFFQLYQQRMEMIDCGVRLLDGVAIGVGDVVGGDIACHDLFTENIAVALYLAALACAAVATVQHAGIGLVVANRPNHALQDERRRSLLALHEGEYHVLVVDIELAHMLNQFECLVESIGEQLLTILS